MDSIELGDGHLAFSLFKVRLDSARRFSLASFAEGLGVSQLVLGLCWASRA